MLHVKWRGRWAEEIGRHMGCLKVPRQNCDIHARKRQRSEFEFEFELGRQKEGHFGEKD